jgi:transposase InsO family protein
MVILHYILDNQVAMQSLTNLSIAWNLYQVGSTPKIIASQLGIHRATAYRWIKRFRTCGFRRTVQIYRSAKKRTRRRINPIVKIHIHHLRTKHHDCCGQKIRYYLKSEYGEEVSLATIYRVLNQKYSLRSKYKPRPRKYGKVPKAVKAKDVIQADTVDFGNVFAYTFIDTYTREVNVILRPTQTGICGKEALREAMKSFKKVRLLQTDGGSEFEGDFKSEVKKYARIHRVSRPYKKNEQAYIESFNRTLRKECLGWKKYEAKDIGKLQGKVDEYLKYYHNTRLHIGLNYQTPQQFLSHLI